LNRAKHSWCWRALSQRSKRISRQSCSTSTAADLREYLVAEGIAVGQIRDGTPGPGREMGLNDPDGHCLMIAQIED
jgi:hypothetical protein